MNLKRTAYYLFFWAFFIYALWVIIFKYAPDFSPKVRILWSGPIAGTIAILFASLKSHAIMEQKSGSDKLKDLSNLILNNAFSFLRRANGLMFTLFLIIFALIFAYVSKAVSACFVVGVISSAIAAFVGTIVAGKANAKAVNQAQFSLDSTSEAVFSSGAVMGLIIIGLTMISIPAMFFLFRDPNIVPGYALGTGMGALFLGISGNIFSLSTNFAVNSVEKNHNLKQESLANPVSISACAGVNIGGLTSMGTNLLFSYASAIVAAMVLGSQNLDLLGVFIPLTLASVGIFSSIAGCVFVKTKETGSPFASIQLGLAISAIMFVALSYYLVEKIFMTAYFPPVLIGILTALLLSFTTRFFTTSLFPPVKAIAKSVSKSGIFAAAMGLKTGFAATFFPVFIVVVSAVATFILSGGMHSYYSGIYGVSLSALSMLSMAGIISAVNSYVPVVENAEKLAEMVELKNETKDRIEKLTKAGNAAEAMGRGFLIASSALVSVIVLIAFALSAHLQDVDMLNPFVITSILFGASVPFLFIALILCPSIISADKISDEAQKQLQEVSQETGSAPVDYKKCTVISAKNSLIGIVPSGVLAVVLPIILGFLVTWLCTKLTGTPVSYNRVNGTQAVVGFLSGAISVGACLSLLIAGTISSYSNARYIVEEKFNELSSSFATSIKNALWTSLDILIKLMAVLALACVNLFMVR